jgi:hypothetical protein
VEYVDRIEYVSRLDASIAFPPACSQLPNQMIALARVNWQSLPQKSGGSEPFIGTTSANWALTPFPQLTDLYEYKAAIYSVDYNYSDV